MATDATQVTSARPGSPDLLPLPGSGDAGPVSQVAREALIPRPSQSPTEHTYATVDLNSEVEGVVQLAQNTADKDQSRAELEGLLRQLKIPKDAQAHLLLAKCHRGMAYVLPSHEIELAIDRAHKELDLVSKCMTTVSKTYMLNNMIFEYSNLIKIVESAPPPPGGFDDVKEKLQEALKKHQQQAASSSAGGAKDEETSWLSGFLFFASGVAAGVAVVLLTQYILQSRNPSIQRQ